MNLRVANESLVRIRQEAARLGKEHDWVGVEITLDQDVPASFVDGDGKTTVKADIPYEVRRYEGGWFTLRSKQADPAFRKTRPGGEDYLVHKDDAMKHFKPVRGTMREGHSMNLRAANESLSRIQRQVMERAEAPPKGKPDLRWDETDIWQAQVEFLMEEPFENDHFFSHDYDLGKIRDDSKSNKEFLEKVEAAGLMDKLKKLAEKDAGEDSDIYRFAWENLTDEITTWMKTQGTDRWVGGVTGFGWRKQEGGKEFRASKGEELLREVLPKTQNRFEVYLEKDQIRIENWHHDAPTGGEWYTIKPATGDEGE